MQVRFLHASAFFVSLVQTFAIGISQITLSFFALPASDPNTQYHEIQHVWIVISLRHPGL